MPVIRRSGWKKCRRLRVGEKRGGGRIDRARQHQEGCVKRIGIYGQLPRREPEIRREIRLQVSAIVTIPGVGLEQWERKRIVNPVIPDEDHSAAELKRMFRL